MALFRNKKAEALEKQLIELKKENKVLSDRIVEIENELNKNEKKQLSLRVSSLEKEKQVAIDNCEALKLQVYKDENESSLISANFFEKEKENKILLKKMDEIEAKLSNNNEKTNIKEHAGISLEHDKEDVSIYKIDDYIDKIKNAFIQKNKLIAEYQTRNDFNDHLQYKENNANILNKISNVIRELKNLNQLLNQVDYLETLNRIESLLSNFKRSKTLITLIAQFNDEKTIELCKSYNDYEKIVIKRDFDYATLLMTNEEKKLIQPDIDQLEALRDKLKKELSAAGYRCFSTIESKTDTVKKNSIIRKEGQTDRGFYSILLKNVSSFEEAIRLYCMNTPPENLLLQSNLTLIGGILQVKKITKERYSSAKLYDVIKQVSATINKVQHK